MSKFEVGDVVECIENIIPTLLICGAGWKLGYRFQITEIMPVGFNSCSCYWKGNSGNGVYEPHLKLVTARDELKIGDRVKIIKNSTDSRSCGVSIGDIGSITLIDKVRNHIIVEEEPNSNGWGASFIPDCLEKIETEIKKGEGEMKKVISDVYEKTQDALLVEKWLGSEIVDNFMGSLIVETYKDEILKEAEEREAEEKKRLEK